MDISSGLILGGGMKLSCPRCGRSTNVDEEIGDFPTRCTCCGALLRRKHGDQAVVTTAPAANVPPATSPHARGPLAGLLISRTTQEEDAPGQCGHGCHATGQQHCVLRPESRKEIARAHARQQALRRSAVLCVNHQELKALTLGRVRPGGTSVSSARWLMKRAVAMFFHPAPPASRRASASRPIDPARPSRV